MAKYAGLAAIILVAGLGYLVLKPSPAAASPPRKPVSWEPSASNPLWYTEPFARIFQGSPLGVGFTWANIGWRWWRGK